MKNLSSLIPEESVLKNKITGNENIIIGAGNLSSKSVLVSKILKDIQKKKSFYLVNFRNEAFEAEKNLKLWTKLEVEIQDFEKMQEKEKVIQIYKMIDKSSEKIFVMIKDDFLLKFPNIQEMENQKLYIEKGQEISTFEIFDWLIKFGYSVAEEKILNPGEYLKQGSSLSIYTPNSELIKIDFFGDNIDGIFEYNQEKGKIIEEKKEVQIYPLKFEDTSGSWSNFLEKETPIFIDEIEDKIANKNQKNYYFLSFPDEEKPFTRLRYFSCLKYYSLPELLTDFRDKILRDWNVICITKKGGELRNILKEEKIPFYEIGKSDRKKRQIGIFNAENLKFIPSSFQNPEEKLSVLTDRELFSFPLKGKGKSIKSKDISMDFLSSLKPGDHVVHMNHGIGRFYGIERKTIDEITREYLRIEYAQGDVLFVPVDQADKISKYIGDADNPPKLTRLGMAEWSSIQKKVKKETKKIAKELLEIFAKRKLAKKNWKCPSDTSEQIEFEKTFPYEETPGQIRAIMDVKNDMESTKPADRLVCGDVGFGKTEVALRAAFKAVKAGKQVAFISPVTILADQHFKTFKRRMDGFHIRIDYLSRFRTPSEQKETLKKLERGDVDIIIGTHRVLQPDVKFKNLGLLMIDEEQKFGVQQKEAIKKLRANIDIFTLTATPIPRTLNMALGKLRDITTINTPPPGRLPIITEVRRYSSSLVRDSIKKEIERGGQVYFLHNRVQTIEGVADRLRNLVPEAKFVVAHGQMSNEDLEERVMDFKSGKFDVLVSSTIIENGIDLSNANTLIVNDADRFGLSQLYQLRGRVGRGKTQAYAYFLYSSQKLKNDAKKRLRAIVEASELGSGFQIAMKDLEIRGAGDILGVSQHGTVNTVGVGHFLRMLSKSVEEMKMGIDKDLTDEDLKEDVVIDIPLPAFIPDAFIPDTKDKISAYQSLASIDKEKELKEIEQELFAEYGNIPEEVRNLFFVIKVKLHAKKAGIKQIKIWTSKIDGKGEIVFWLSKSVTPAHIMNLISVQKGWQITGEKLRIRFRKLTLGWTEKLLTAVKALETPLEAGKK